MALAHNPLHAGQVPGMDAVAEPHDVDAADDFSSSKPGEMVASHHPIVRSKYAVLPARNEIITSEHVQQLAEQGGI